MTIDTKCGRYADNLSSLKDTNGSDFDDEPIVPQFKRKDKSRDIEHKSLSVAQLQDQVNNDISHVASIIGLEVQHSPVYSSLSTSSNQHVAFIESYAILCSCYAFILHSSAICNPPCHA